MVQLSNKVSQDDLMVLKIKRHRVVATLPGKDRTDQQHPLYTPSFRQKITWVCPVRISRLHHSLRSLPWDSRPAHPPLLEGFRKMFANWFYTLSHKNRIRTFSPIKVSSLFGYSPNGYHEVQPLGILPIILHATSLASAPPHPQLPLLLGLSLGSVSVSCP